MLGTKVDLDMVPFKARLPCEGGGELEGAIPALCLDVLQQSHGQLRVSRPLESAAQ